MGHIWPPLKISSNVVFSISHLLNKIKLRTEHVPACRKKVTAFLFFMHFSDRFIKFKGVEIHFAIFYKLMTLQKTCKHEMYLSMYCQYT